MEPRILTAWPLGLLQDHSWGNWTQKPGWPNEKKLREEQLPAVLGSAARQPSSFVSE